MAENAMAKRHGKTSWQKRRKTQRDPVLDDAVAQLRHFHGKVICGEVRR